MKIVLTFEYFRKPLSTKHHEYKNGRPRPGRRFDWTLVRTEAAMSTAAHAAWRKRVYLWHLWLYTRDATGAVLGRLVCIGWVRSQSSGGVDG